MNRRSALRTLVAGSAGSFLSSSFLSSGLSAAAGGEEPPDFVLRSDSVLVMLDVSVKDRQGRFVPGLEKRDFSVLEDGKAQTISVFDSEDRPVDMGILVDQSGSMIPKRLDTITAAETLIEDSNPQDEVFILHFNDRVTPGLPADVPFSGQRQALRDALARGFPSGKTALNDAVADGLDHLKLGMRDKKTLVLISDGGDNASAHTRQKTLEMVESGIATIYAIGVYDDDDPDRDPAFLRRLANTSGGEAYFPSAIQELAPVCRHIAKEIRTRYTVGYVPHAIGRNSVRRIQVVASTPDHGRLNVRARTRYRYDEIAK
jgi:VWFA-related protein